MTDLIKKSIVKYLTGKKHVFGKYILEIFNVEVFPDTIHIDLNVIPTENNTSYVYKVFECNFADILDEICTLLSIDKSFSVKIKKRYFNGKEVDEDDYSISEKFNSKVLESFKNTMGVLKMQQYINGKKSILGFYCDYMINFVDNGDQDYTTFYVVGEVKKFTIDGVEQKNVSKVIKNDIASYLPYLFDSDRESIENDIWGLLNKDQDVFYCDLFINCIIDYSKVLGDSVEGGTSSGNSDYFKSHIEDYVNGDR